MRRGWMFAALLTIPAAASADPPPARTMTVTVYGSDPCPNVAPDEIVVCARRPENERYRIPKELRHKGDRPSETSWSSQLEGLEEGARAERPGSCSVVGSYGQSGCYQRMIDQWYAERRARGR